MTKFYTNVSRYGNNLLYRGYEDGHRVKKKIKFKPTLYVKGKGNSEFTSLDGINVDPIKFDSMRDAKDFCEKYEGVNNFTIYGNQNYIAQFVAEEFPNEIKFDRNKIRIHNFDIEVDSAGQGFPEPSEAKFPVTSICLYDSIFDKYLVWSTVEFDPDQTAHKDVSITYVKCKDEQTLLSFFINYWYDEYTCPDVVTGWNIRTFDIPYLVNRINRLFGEDSVKKLSPWGMVEQKTVTMRKGQVQIYDITGISQLDYLDLFQKFGYSFGPQENYRLDTIANVVLGERKMDYSEYGSLYNLIHENPQLYVDYNIKDTILVSRMEDKIAMITLCLTMAYKAGVNYNDTFGTTGIWDSLIHRTLMNEKIIVPPNLNKFKGDYDGGYVKEPQCGVHDWVCSFDVNSLYPNIIVQWNMSPETLLKGDVEPNITVEKMLDGYINKTDKSMAATGQYFDNSKQGFMPRIIEQMYEERVQIKKKMLASKKELEACDKSNKQEVYRIERDIAHFENQQTAIKILLNSLYGAMGNKYFRYFTMEIAEGITITGQFIIKWAEKHINEYLNKALKSNKDYVIAIDTDSVIGSTIINVNGYNITIADYFDSMPNNYIRYDDFNSDYVKTVCTEDFTYSVSSEGELRKNKINYVMKHRIKKELFKITNSLGQSVTVTQDHSVIVKDKTTGEIKSIKPCKLNREKHQIINIIDTDSIVGLQNAIKE